MAFSEDGLEIVSVNASPPDPHPFPSPQACTRARASAARVGEGKSYPAAASFAGFASPAGGVNRASSGRLIAAWRVGVVICAPRRSVT